MLPIGQDPTSGKGIAHAVPEVVNGTEAAEDLLKMQLVRLINQVLL